MKMDLRGWLGVIEVDMKSLVHDGRLVYDLRVFLNSDVVDWFVQQGSDFNHDITVRIGTDFETIRKQGDPFDDIFQPDIPDDLAVMFKLRWHP